MSVVRAFETAFNAADIAALLRLLHGGRDLRRHLLRQPHRAGAGSGRCSSACFTKDRGIGGTWSESWSHGALAAAEWTFSYTVTNAVPRSAGRLVRFPGMSIFELEHGLIASYREYFDMGAALLQLGFTGESIAKVLRRHRMAPDASVAP